MFRATRLPRLCLPAAASAIALFVIVAFGPPAAAQQTGASQAEAKSTSNEPADDDDELLRPSNTGYVDDAIVGSKFRLRYDSATGATKPDRAEFIYGKCSCFNALFGQDAASPGPAANLDFEEFELTYEHAFSDRFSLFFELPFRSVDLALGGPFAGQRLSASGIGDVRAGLKYALIAAPDRYLTFQLRSYFASGDAKENLGTNHASIEPGFLYFSKPRERLTLSSEIRWWHPLSGSSDPVSGASGRIPGFEIIRGEPGGAASPVPPDPRVRNNDYAGDILRFGIGASHEGRGSKISVSPVAELVGWYVLDGYVFFPGDPVEAANDTIVNLKLGVRIRGGGPGSFYLGYGIPLSNDDWYDGILRFEYRLPLAAPKRHKAKMAAARAAKQRAAEDRAAAARAAAESEAPRAAAEVAAREAEAKRAEAETAAREAEARKAAAEAAALQAEARNKEAAAAVPTHSVADTATPCLNLRAEPALSADRQDCLEPGSLATELVQQDRWSRVRLEDGREGWVASRYLDPQSSASPASQSDPAGDRSSASDSSAVVEEGS